MSEFYILKEGKISKAADIKEWGQFMETKDKIVKQEDCEINDKKYFVSTIFLGIDHGFGFAKKVQPILFETMIFPEEELENWEEYQTRCCTLEEALKQHQEAIDFLKPL